MASVGAHWAMHARKGRGKAVFVAEENIRLRPPPDAGRLKMLMPASTGSKLPTMKVADLKEVVEREPFRPFIVRLNNGAQYTFKTARNVGASMDYGMIFYFGEPRGAVRIDSDSIVEIIEGE